MSKSSKNIIIGLETGLDGGGISILDNENPVDSVCGSGNISKSEDLLSLLEGLLEKHAIKKREIGLIAVSDGPGSLTGIRIGLALAKGLGDALSVPVRYISILDAMAALTPLAKSEGTVLSVLSTMKNGNYLKEYSFRDGKLRIESEIIKKNEKYDLIDALNNFKKESVSVVYNQDFEPIISEFRENQGLAQTFEFFKLRGSLAEVLGKAANRDASDNEVGMNYD